MMILLNRSCRPSLLLITTLGTTAILPLGAIADESKPNTLSAGEKDAGWQLLFDGRKPTSWRSFGKASLPGNGWEVSEGWLIKKGGQKPGNLVTRQEFTDFEFSWEWRMARGGNNGVKYFVDEKRGKLGHEYQMLANPDDKASKGATAGFYAVLAPHDLPAIKAAPEINHSRISVQGRNVRHWLNGKLVLEYTCGSEKVLANVALSKFKNVPNFGKKLTARIMLTDHGSECAFRNLKIRELSAGDAKE